MGKVIRFREPPGTLRRLLQRSGETQKRRRLPTKDAPEVVVTDGDTITPLFRRRRRV